MFLYYRNSFLASMFSVAGCVLGMAGIGLLFTGLIPPGIGLIAAAAVLFYIAKQISRKKSFDQWWKQIEKAGLEPEIRNSLDVAVQIYKKNPEPRTLEKIRSLNPTAADYIQNGFRIKAPNAYQMPRSTEPEKAPQESVPQSQKNTSLFCTNCGSQLPSGCKFCSNCGTPVAGQRSGSAVLPPNPTGGSRKEAKPVNEKRKLWFLLIALFVLLALLINGIYRDAKEEQQLPPVSVQTEATLPKGEQVAIRQEDTPERFEYESGYTFPIVFAEPLYGCTEFTLEYEIYLMDENPPADSVLCDIYARTTTGGWEMIASFQMEGTMESHRIYLDGPMDIDSVAVVYHGQAPAYDIRVFDPAY